MKTIKIGKYKCKIYKTDYGRLYGRVYNLKNQPVNEFGATIDWSIGQKWISSDIVDMTEKDIEESFACWLFNIGKLPKTNKYYKRWR